MNPALVNLLSHTLFHVRAQIDSVMSRRRSLATDNRAQGRMENGVEMAIGLVVFMLVAAYTVPLALDEWYNASTSGWPDNIVNLWDLVPFFIVLAFVLFAIYWGLQAKDQ